MHPCPVCNFADGRSGPTLVPQIPAHAGRSRFWRSTDPQRDQRVYHGHRSAPWCSSAGFEPVRTAPEAVGLYLADVEQLLHDGPIGRPKTAPGQTRDAA